MQVLKEFQHSDMGLFWFLVTKLGAQMFRSGQTWSPNVQIGSNVEPKCSGRNTRKEWVSEWESSMTGHRNVQAFQFRVMGSNGPCHGITFLEWFAVDDARMHYGWIRMRHGLFYLSTSIAGGLDWLHTGRVLQFAAEKWSLVVPNSVRNRLIQNHHVVLPNLNLLIKSVNISVETNHHVNIVVYICQLRTPECLWMW